MFGERDDFFLPVLTAARLCELMGLPSERASRDFIRREGVPHVRAGGRVYVRTAALLEWLAAREIVPESSESIRKRAEDTIRNVAPPRRRGR